MDGVLEKITLYDILGYFVPGSLLVVICLLGADPKDLISHLEQWADYKGGLYFVFFLISYLAGIVLSEVMAWAWKPLIALVGKENKIPKEITSEQILAALKKSGVCDEEDSIKTKMEEDFMGYYFPYMYGIIQKSDSYKRIHNYASAYVLYKNVAGALILGACTMLRNDVSNKWIGTVCIIMSIVFGVRGVRFQEKRNRYAIIWFVEKFTREG